MSSLHRIWAVTAKELKQLSRDRVTFGMVVMIPLIQLLLFGYAINTEVRNIPIAVVDLSGSAFARTITEQVRVTQVVDIRTYYHTPREAEAAIVAGTVRAASMYTSQTPACRARIRAAVAAELKAYRDADADGYAVPMAVMVVAAERR